MDSPVLCWLNFIQLSHLFIWQSRISSHCNMYCYVLRLSSNSMTYPGKNKDEDSNKSSSDETDPVEEAVSNKDSTPSRFTLSSLLISSSIGLFLLRWKGHDSVTISVVGHRSNAMESGAWSSLSGHEGRSRMCAASYTVFNEKPILGSPLFEEWFVAPSSGTHSCGHSLRSDGPSIVIGKFAAMFISTLDSDRT